MSKETNNEDLKKQIKRIKTAGTAYKCFTGVSIGITTTLTSAAASTYIEDIAASDIAKINLEIDLILRDKKLSEDEKQEKIAKLQKQAKRIKIGSKIAACAESFGAGITGGTLIGWVFDNVDKTINKQISDLTNSSTPLPAPKKEEPKKVSTKPSETKKDKK